MSEYGLQHIHNLNAASYQYVKIAHVNGANLPEDSQGLANLIDVRKTKSRGDFLKNCLDVHL